VEDRGLPWCWLKDIVRILNRFPVPANVHMLVVMIGINDKNGFQEQPMVNSITRSNKVHFMFIRQIFIM